MIKTLRDFPSVEQLLQEKSLVNVINRLPRPVATEIIRQETETFKDKLRSNKLPISKSSFFGAIGKSLLQKARGELRRVINATGIVVHTNLGRAPLGSAGVAAISESVTGYANVEFDLNSGKRGRRGEAAEHYLAMLSGAESAAIVNNCAAALLLILNTLANRGKVIISRGELVQIGGGFRIPEILRKSGARLVEVGTTNITTIDDYADGIDDKTALILKVHKSNFTQTGFTDEVLLKDIVALGAKHSLPVINDLGSGAFMPTAELFGYKEPTAGDSVKSGADLTCFSGDKLVGGVQAGLIVGKAGMIARLKKNPIYRALRVDKIVLAILEKLLRVYLDSRQSTDIPLWKLLAVSESELYTRAHQILDRLGKPSGLSVTATKAFVGGGALPGWELPSVAIVFSSDYKARQLVNKFRALEIPVIGRVEQDSFVIDLKAISEDELGLLHDAIKSVIE